MAGRGVHGREVGAHGREGVCVAGGMHSRGCVWWGHKWQMCVCGAWQEGLHSRECSWQGACVAGETATAVDDTHPTGMHSCLK